jgi:hypothetical protein
MLSSLTFDCILYYLFIVKQLNNAVVKSHDVVDFSCLFGPGVTADICGVNRNI